VRGPPSDIGLLSDFLPVRTYRAHAFSDALIQRVSFYNNVRLNSAIGYVTPKDMLAGHQQEIQADRDRKLERRGNSGRIAASGRPDE
jgi:hypothetical protein